MPKPQAVIDAEARANELQMQLSGQGTPAIPQAPDQGAIVMPPGLPSLTADPAPAAGVPAPAAPQPAAPAQPGSLEEEVRRLAASLTVLQGKYNAEVPAQAREIRELREQNTALQQENEALKAGGGKAASINELDAVIRDELGDKVADSIMALVKGQVGTIQSKVDAVGATASRSLEQIYFDAIARAHPTWKTINVSDEFLLFLEEKVPYGGGATFRDRLAEAHGNLDSNSVIEIFTAFKEKQPQQPAAANTGLDIAPSRAGGGGPSANPNTNKRFWTRAEVAQVYDAKRRGLLTTQQFEAYEAEFDAAIHEGRMERAR